MEVRMAAVNPLSTFTIRRGIRIFLLCHLQVWRITVVLTFSNRWYRQTDRIVHVSQGSGTKYFGCGSKKLAHKKKLSLF